MMMMMMMMMMMWKMSRLVCHCGRSRTWKCWSRNCKMRCTTSYWKQVTTADVLSASVQEVQLSSVEQRGLTSATSLTTTLET
ncbi:hypothetical protein SRHO_G00337840 [Serrasalmus rhombeus]